MYEYEAKHIDNFIRHFESQHEGLFHKCSQCIFQTINKHNFKIHVETEHEVLFHYCDQCDYAAKEEVS